MRTSLYPIDSNLASPDSASIDRDAIKSWLSRLTDPERKQLHEVRAIPTDAMTEAQGSRPPIKSVIWVGTPDDELIDWICEQNAAGYGCYATLNPCKLDNPVDEVEPGWKVSGQLSDKQIGRRYHILIDFDRESETTSGPATSTQMEAAKTAAVTATDLLAELMPECHTGAIISTGNGSGIWLPCNLANDEQAKTLVKRLLEYTGSLPFVAESGMKVDTSVSNASRVARIPGTLNTKFQPHRPVFIIRDTAAQLRPAGLDDLLACLPLNMQDLTVRSSGKRAGKAGRPPATVTNNNNTGQLDTRFLAYITPCLRDIEAATDGNKHRVLVTKCRKLGSDAAGFGVSSGLSSQIASMALEALGKCDSEVKDWNQARRDAEESVLYGFGSPNVIVDRPLANERRRNSDAGSGQSVEGGSDGGADQDVFTPSIEVEYDYEGNPIPPSEDDVKKARKLAAKVSELMELLPFLLSSNKYTDDDAKEMGWSKRERAKLDHAATLDSQELWFPVLAMLEIEVGSEASIWVANKLIKMRPDALPPQVAAPESIVYVTLRYLYHHRAEYFREGPGVPKLEDGYNRKTYSRESHAKLTEKYPMAQWPGAVGFEASWQLPQGLAARFLLDNKDLFRSWKQDFYAYDFEGGKYDKIERPDVSNTLRSWLIGDAGKVSDERSSQPPKVDKALVSNVEAAVESYTAISSRTVSEMPYWISGTPEGMPAGDCIAFKNVILNARTRATVPVTPDYFSVSNTGYEFEGNDAAPVEWLKFLRTIWGDDWSSAIELQKYFGYCLTADDRYHKALMLIGPPRSGKGTIMNTLRSILGGSNTTDTTMSKLGKGGFSYASLIGKSVAFLPDVVMPSNQDQVAAATEFLLSVSGGDHVAIERKWLGDWEGKLNTKFFMSSNSLPRFAGTSGGLASRLHVLSMTRSFEGHEDRTWAAKIALERNQIMNWAILGLELLEEHGFTPTEGGLEAAEDIRSSSEPLYAFCREYVEPAGPDSKITLKDLYKNWKQWCEETGHKAGNMDTMKARLKTCQAFPGKYTGKQAKINREVVRPFYNVQWRDGKGILSQFGRPNN